MIALGLLFTGFIGDWRDPDSRFLINAVAFALMAWHTRLLVLLPCLVYTELIRGEPIRTWFDWGERIGDWGVIAIVVPLFLGLLFEPGAEREPWYRRPQHRPEILTLAFVSALAIAMVLGNRTTHGPRLGIYLWPFLVLCAVQAFRPFSTASGMRRADPLGRQRHWLLTLSVCLALGGYLLAGSDGEWNLWRYYAQVHIFPMGLVAYCVFRAFPPGPIEIPATALTVIDTTTQETVDMEDAGTDDATTDTVD